MCIRDRFDRDAEKTIKQFKEQVARQEALKPLEAAVAGLRRKIAALDAERFLLELADSEVLATAAS